MLDHDDDYVSLSRGRKWFLPESQSNSFLQFEFKFNFICKGSFFFKSNICNSYILRKNSH